MKHASKLATILVFGTVLTGCGIGEGSTLEKLEIVPASSTTQLKTFEVGDSYKVFQCLRDELIARATFTDGTVVNFSNRVAWSTSDAAIVQVSNGDIPVTLLTANPAEDGSFYLSDSLMYARGTVVPLGLPGDEATISVRFSDLSASVVLKIRKPELRIVPVPGADPASAVPPYHLGQGTLQRFTVLADLDGRIVPVGNLNPAVLNVFSINPFRWVFTTGAFVPRDDAVADAVDEWVVTDGPDQIARMRTIGTDGLVIGSKANYQPYPVMAETSLCEGSADPVLLPTAQIKVATVIDLVLSREQTFTGGGFAVQDQVAGTSQQMRLVGNLDANGDGLTIVTQLLDTLANYVVRPLDNGCEDDDIELGCTSNATFSASAGSIGVGTAPTEGATARVQACFPRCLTARASLEADDASVATGVAVNFTATGVNVPSGTNLNYLFDFGDGTTAGPQASPLASHAYAAAGQYTATVRLIDAGFPDEFLSPNAGAVRVLADVMPAGTNTAPTAVLTASASEGDAPLTVTFSGVGSNDADSGEAVTVYEFDPGDGTPVIRQTSATLTHVYVSSTNAPFTPTLKVYDQSGVASAVDTPDDDADTARDESEVAVSGAAPQFLKSNVLDLRARKGTLCSVELLPPLASAPTEAAFTFPGARFQALGSFVADTETETCADPVIGTQLITRSMTWTVRPSGEADEVSDIAAVRGSPTDFLFPGQVIYFNDVAAPTTLDVTAQTLSPFPTTLDATPTTLTVTPCTTCTP